MEKKQICIKMEKKGEFEEMSTSYGIVAEEIILHASKENLIIGAAKNVFINGAGNGIIYKPNDERKEEVKEVQLKDHILNYETDGHYSTVYLVCLLLGMSEDLALELAIATEDPDTDVHSETDFEIDQTWSNPFDQENIHSLTGGFHGTEEFLTAVKFLYLKEVETKGVSKETNHANTIKRWGELLHRFGDTYAHVKFDNILPKDLSTYDLKENKENEKKAIAAWKGKGGKELSADIKPWIIYFNYYTNKYGYQFLTDAKYQRMALGGETLASVLRDIYLIKPSDKYIMYGGNENSISAFKIKFTWDHFSTDAGYPDLIYMRPEWYLVYVKNLAWILSIKFKLSLKNFDISIFERMVNFAVKNTCSMKGIIDFEISKKMNKSITYIPVFYSKPGRPFASVDAIYMSDYLNNAKSVVENTKLYLQENGSLQLNIGKEAHYGETKIHVKKGGHGYNPFDYETYSQNYFIIEFRNK